MLKIITSIFVLCISLASTEVAASGDPFIHERERLIAFSDKTYTVIVKQFESLHHYSSIHRFLVRVIDISTNKFISEVLISSTRTDFNPDAAIVNTHSIMTDESQAIGKVMLHPQKLYDNLESPKSKYHLDRDGFYLLNKEGREDILDIATIKNRFMEEKPSINRRYDGTYFHRKSIYSNALTITGWYKVSIKERGIYFLVLKTGNSNDTGGSLEYVFSVPNAKD